MKNNSLIFTSLLILVFNSVFAQDKPLELSLGTLKTELKQNAIDFGIRYVKSLDSLFSEQDIFLARRNSLFQATPEFNVQSGTDDAFSSIDIKMTGLFMFFKTTTISTIETPCTACYMHLLPISLGVESNSTFTSINGILEFGYVPWYQSARMDSVASWIKHTKVGVFFQGGYKFDLDSNGIDVVGGQIDESKEKINSEIFRIKGSFGVDSKSLFELNGVGFGLVMSSDVWYDFLNSEIYYTVSGKARFYLTQNNDRFFDLKYQKGSGAPNFNEGDQFGLGLTLAF